MVEDILEDSTKTEPSLQPIPTFRVLEMFPFPPLSCSAVEVMGAFGGPQNAMQEETQEERASSVEPPLPLLWEPEANVTGRERENCSSFAHMAASPGTRAAASSDRKTAESVGYCSAAMADAPAYDVIPGTCSLTKACPEVHTTGVYQGPPWAVTTFLRAATRSSFSPCCS